MTRYIPLERPLFHAQQFYQNNNFIITFISVSLISFVLWFLILGLSIFGFRWYYEEARLSKYAPMGLCLAILSYCIFCQSAPRWYDGWDATHGSWHFPVPYEKIFIGNVMILLVGSIILKGIKKPVFYSLLFVYSIILSSFYFIFNISNNLFSGEELFLIYELINYTTNSNLLGFLIWYIVFALAFWIYIKEIFPEDFSSASSDINTKNA
jgi:hypothetical protein